MKLLAVFTLFVILMITLAVLLTITDTAQAAINDNLLACWDLDETSGTRVDEAGNYDLTDNNTTGYVVGKIGNGSSSIAANTEYLSNVSIDLNNTSFTIAHWYDDDDQVVASGFSFGLSSFSTLSFQTCCGGDRAWWFKGSRRGGYVDATGMNQVIGVYDESAETFKTYHNGELKTNNTGITALSGSGTTLELHQIANYFQNLDLDVFVIWTRPLTTSEITDLYNSGNGRDCDYIVAGGATPTPTASYTPTPTATPTPTPTPIVDLDTVYTYTLSSGNTAAIDRTVTYGDMALFALVGVVAVPVLVLFVISVVRKFM